MNWTKYQIECDGITNSIKQVTKDPYIIGYLDLLKISILNQDKNIANEVTSRLIHWYGMHLDAFLKDPFIYDKANQEKTFLLLKKMKKDLRFNFKKYFKNELKTLKI